jgi:hypothetical protein
MEGNNGNGDNVTGNEKIGALKYIHIMAATRDTSLTMWRKFGKLSAREIFIINAMARHFQRTGAKQLSFDEICRHLRLERGKHKIYYAILWRLVWKGLIEQVEGRNNGRGPAKSYRLTGKGLKTLQYMEGVLREATGDLDNLYDLD